MTYECEAAPNMTQSILFSRRSLLGSAALALVIATLPRAVWAQTLADQATAFIDKTSQELSSAVNGSGSTTAKAAALQTVIDHAVDVSSVGRFCLGRFWRLASPSEQAEYIELFHRVLVQNITGKVGDYQGVSITVVRTAPREDGVAVTTSVSRPNSAPNRVDWLVNNESGTIKIVDVIAEGTSLRLTQRNDYAAFLSRNNNSVAALITALRQQLAAG